MSSNLFSLKDWKVLQFLIKFYSIKHASKGTIRKTNWIFIGLDFKLSQPILHFDETSYKWWTMVFKRESIQNSSSKFYKWMLKFIS